jgi:hypothetical protein
MLDHEGRAEDVEHHKQDLLKKQKEGKGHWKDELASNSESIVCLSFSLHLTLLFLGDRLSPWNRGWVWWRWEEWLLVPVD